MVGVVFSVPTNFKTHYLLHKKQYRIEIRIALIGVYPPRLKEHGKALEMNQIHAKVLSSKPEAGFCDDLFEPVLIALNLYLKTIPMAVSFTENQQHVRDKCV